jgi:exodeoxyribonuclease-5
LNSQIRKNKGFDITRFPYTSERVVCLKNNWAKGLFNGQMGTVAYMMPRNGSFADVAIILDSVEDMYLGIIPHVVFGTEKPLEEIQNVNRKDLKEVKKSENLQHMDIFDYGYFLTCHKSQSCGFKRVILVEDRPRFWDDEYYSRWLYTAVTRSEEKLFVISNYNSY